MMATNPIFEFKGVNHLALVCRDMAKTVEFYREVLGMPLVKTIDLPGGQAASISSSTWAMATAWRSSGSRRHRKRCRVFRRPPIPADASGNFIVGAHGSMNHIALNVPMPTSSTNITSA